MDGNEGLDRLSDGVHAARGGYPGRDVKRELGIDDRGLGEKIAVADGRLDEARGVGDDGVWSGLGARAACSRNRNDRQTSACRLLLVEKDRRRLALAGQSRGRLGGVHGAATAYADDNPGGFAMNRFTYTVNRRDRRVLLHAVKDRRRNPSFTEDGKAPVEDAQAAEALPAGDDERPAAKARSDPAELLY